MHPRPPGAIQSPVVRRLCSSNMCEHAALNLCVSADPDPFFESCLREPVGEPNPFGDDSFKDPRGSFKSRQAK